MNYLKISRHIKGEYKHLLGKSIYLWTLVEMIYSMTNFFIYIYIPKFPSNENIIQEFINYCELQHLKTLTIENKLWQIKTFAEFIKDADLKKAEQKTIEKFVIYLKRSGKKESTQQVNIIQLKYFFEWVSPGNGLFKNIKIKKPKKDTSQKEYISTDDVIKLLAVCRTQRDRALLFTLWESGARIGELVALDIGDVKTEQHGIIITVTGKTGRRDILLIDSVPDLQLYLNQLNGRKEDPLFQTTHGSRLTKKGAQFFISRLAKRAGIEGKQISAHSYRHGRLTELSNLGLSEMQLRLLAGWSRSSDQPATYLHTTKKDIFDKLKSIKGIKQEDDVKPEEKTTTKKCVRCGTENPFDSKYCRSCSLILDTKTAFDIENTSQEMNIELFKVALSDPAVQTDLLELMKKLK